MARQSKSGSPLLSASRKVVLAKEKIEIPEPLLNEAKAYAEWAGIETFDEVVQQALEYVLSADKEWKKLQSKPTRKATKPDLEAVAEV